MHRSGDAKALKGHRFLQITPLTGSKDMRETLVPMAIPALAAHLSEVEFMYSDNKYYELCGQMGHLIGPSGIGKAQLSSLIEAIQRSFRDHDEVNTQQNRPACVIIMCCHVCAERYSRGTSRNHGIPDPCRWCRGRGR